MEDVELVRHPRARRAKLAFDPASGRVRLTLPSRASAAKALAWAATQDAWIAAQRARLPEGRPFVDGASIPFDGATITLAWAEGSSRRIVRDGDRLLAAGPPETLARRIEAWLRREALLLLEADTALYAARAGVAVSRVSVGDARGRWGSCALTGAIRYNWRLALAPPEVRRATAAHEVAHRVHMNHSPAFHTLVAQLFGRDPAPERAWLRAHGAGLYWVGRSSSGAG